MLPLLHFHIRIIQVGGIEDGADVLAQIGDLTNARARHLEVKAELKATTELQVRVTTIATTTSLFFPPLVRIAVQSAVAGVGEVLWSPDVPAGVPEVKVDREEKEIVTMETVAKVGGVQGVFVREWGEEGKGQGQFNKPESLAVNGEEVFVCDSSNCRMQVFGLDGAFRREWGEEGEGQGQFFEPSSVAVHGEEVFVCESGNHRVQVFK
jgi:hypothetical protein